MSLWEWVYFTGLAVVLALWVCEAIGALTAAVRELSGVLAQIELKRK